jgi:hypothetical protein
VQHRHVGGDSKPESGQMRGEREIDVVAVESVERDLVEAHAFEDLAIRRHEESVERLHPMDERRGHRADEDAERRDLPSGSHTWPNV